MNKTGSRRPRNAAHRNDAAEETQDLRALCGALQFWRVCGKPACRRACDCRGDAQACFRRFWWQMPEHARVWVRAVIRESAGSRGRKTAVKVADAEVARWQSLQARYAPAQVSAPAALPAPADRATPDRTVPDRAMPRIRTL